MDEPRFTQTSSVFAMRCEVEVTIRTGAEIVWSLLSDASGFSRSGAMFALTKRMLPDFRPIFEAYANDLRREAERIAGVR